MKILALDCGVEKTGYAFFDKDRKLPNGYKFISSGLVFTKKNTALESRLNIIYKEIIKLIKINKPDHIVIEELFFLHNQKTAIMVAQAQGVMLLAASQSGIPISTLTPLQIKKNLTGYGNADKQSVQKMLKLLMGPSAKFATDDEADAVACGLAFCTINERLV